MSEPVVFAQQFKVQGPDGTVLLIGTGRVKALHEFVNSSTSIIINAGEAVGYDGTNSLSPIVETVAAGTALPSYYPQTDIVFAVPVASGTVNLFGVALGTAPKYPGALTLPALPPGAPSTQVACGGDSLVTVRCKSTLTSATLGNKVIGAAASGANNLVDATTSSTTYGVVLGQLIKANGTSAGQTGDVNYCGVIVAPGT